MKLSTFQQGIGLIVIVAICFAVAGVGGFVTAANISGWYAHLAKSAWPGRASQQYSTW